MGGFHDIFTLFAFKHPVGIRPNPYAYCLTVVIYSKL